VSGDPTSYPTSFKLFSTVSNRYGLLNGPGQVLFLELSAFASSAFTLTGTVLTTTLHSQSVIATGNLNSTLTYVTFVTATAIAANPNDVVLTCSCGFSGAYCVLNCQVDPTHNMQLSDGYWYIGDSVPPGYTQFTPVVVDPSTL
jgi:hypothetical protein